MYVQISRMRIKMDMKSAMTATPSMMTLAATLVEPRSVAITSSV
jgi:hypothetical protein